MIHKFFNKNFIIIFVVDVLLLTAALYDAFLIRFEFNIPPFYFDLFLRMLPYVIVTKIACLYFFDLYRGMWRYTSISDLLNIIKAATASSLLITIFIAFKMRFIGYPRSVFVIDWFLTILFIAGFRLLVRLFFERLAREKSEKSMPQQFMRLFKHYPKSVKRLLDHRGGRLRRKNIT